MKGWIVTGVPRRLLAAGMMAAMAAMAAAAGASPPASLEAEVLDELNHVRANPADYAEELREYRRDFEGTMVYSPDDPEGQNTREGVRAVDDAIRFLERQAPLPPLSHGDILALAAQDHARDQGGTGVIGHVGAGGTSPGERVRRRGGDIYVGEVISYGQRTARAVVRQLVVNDGVPRRGHRLLVFSPAYRFAGVGCDRHRGQGSLCVVKLAATADGGPRLPASAD